MNTERGDQLLTELITNPIRFSEQGTAYTLLQEYFKGYDKETLRPLLQSKDPITISAATFIVSELGRDAASLIEDLIPLLNNDNLRVRYEVLESIFICSSDINAEKFVYVLNAMNDANDVIRLLAMDLTSKANEQQIKAAIRFFGQKEDGDSKIHFQCLPLMLKGENQNPEGLMKMINDKLPLIRKYGAILSKLVFAIFPELIKDATLNADTDIQNFAIEFLNETQAS